MFSPKKESCLSPGPRRAGSFALGLEGGIALAGSEELRMRDKALPDRLVIASLVCDAVVIVYALIFSFWCRFQTGISELGVSAEMHLADYGGYIALGSISLLLTLTGFGIYERVALLRFRFVSLQILKGALLWAGGFLLLAMAFNFEPMISRVFVGISAVLVPAMLLSWRWLFHRVLARSSVAMSLRQRLLFVGWNDESDKLTRAFTTEAGSAYEVVGCLSSSRKWQRQPSIEVLGSLSQITSTIRQHAIDMVVLTDMQCVRGDIIGLANTCEREMVQFKVIPSYFQILVSGLHLETVSGIPILGVSRLPLDRFHNILLKRVVDVIGASIGLMICIPLIAIFGAIVYRESPGPILYRQRRMGRRGIEFDIFKIRSMKLDAEAGGVGWTKQDDPRRLAIGAFHAEVEYRRGAAILERAQRRDEPRRPAA
jgi:hypothetical protein